MKIAMISGSPKVKKSASEFNLNELRTQIIGEHEIKNFFIIKQFMENELLNELIDYDIWVFAFPLYGDSIPSHLLRCLVQAEEYLKSVQNKKITVYGIVNCGFYEGHQNRFAIEVLRNWCRKSGLVWGTAIGIGGGGVVPHMKNKLIAKIFMKNYNNAIKKLASCISKSCTGEVIFSNPNITRFAFKKIVEHYWRKTAKANGLTEKELFYKDLL